jgi:hypothetical protein
MGQIQAIPVPDNALLARDRDSGAWADCYRLDIARDVTLPAYIEAFYTTPLFKLERAVLTLVKRGASDRDAADLASGRSHRFAAWTVEGRTETEILLCDYLGKTRSWLSAAPAEKRTRLMFGSAVVPHRSASGRTSLGPVFHALLGFHKAYSRALLRSAANALEGN